MLFQGVHMNHQVQYIHQHISSTANPTSFSVLLHPIQLKQNAHQRRRNRYGAQKGRSRARVAKKKSNRKDAGK